MTKTFHRFRRPIFMVNVTEDCQLRCKHCYNSSGQADSQSPPLDQLLSRLDKLIPHAGSINFTGGEPLLVDGIGELLESSSAHGIDTIITSNGLRLLEADGNDLISRLAPFLTMVKIGMMGAKAETNDRVRGKGNFEVSLNSLDLLADHDVISCIKISLDRHNMNEIEPLVELALRHKVDQIVFGQLINIGRAEKHLQEQVLSPEDLLRVEQSLTEVKKKYWNQIKIARHCTLSGSCQGPGEYYTLTARRALGPCLMREDLAVGDLARDDASELIERVDQLRSRTRNHSSHRDRRPVHRMTASTASITLGSNH